MIDPSNLTPDQKKAFQSLKRAVKKCEAANIYWYQVLDSLHPLNGDIVKSVEEACGCNAPEGSIDTNDLFLETVTVTCSWADDSHYVVLKEGQAND